MNKLYSAESESELLGAMLKDSEVIPEVIEVLTVDDFFVAKNKLIYSNISKLYKGLKTVDAITVYESMTGSEVTLTEILELSKISASPTAYQTYSTVIKDFSNKRKLKALCEKTLTEIDNRTADKTASLLSSEIYKLSEERTKQATRSDLDSMAEVINYIAKAKETKGESVGLKTGWKMVDIATNGFERGTLNFLAGRPAMGKTSVMLSLADKVAQNGYRCLVFEQEMSETAVTLRRLSAKTNISFQKIKKGMITDEEFASLVNKADILADNNRIFVDYTPAIKLTEVRNRIRKIKQQGGLDFVFIDHIGYMGSEEKAESRTRELSVISKGLKAIANEYDVVIICLSQLNREVEKRANKRPMLSDLNESGSLEQDADIVIGVYRDEYYNPLTTEITEGHIEELELIFLKNRDAPNGTIVMNFNKKTQSITEPYN